MATVIINESGQIQFLATEELESLSQLSSTATKRRASHVHPSRKSLRIAFYALRAIAGENGRVGNWTRKWACLWSVDLAISGGPQAGPFDIRSEAIAFEENWLAEKLSQ